MRKESNHRVKNSARKVLQTICAASRKEEGSFVLFTTLMILLLLTLTGIAATKTANTEISIAGNEAARNVNTYLAEGGAVEAAMLIDGMNDDDLKVVNNGGYPQWMTYHSEIDPNDPDETMKKPDNWVSEGGTDDNAAISAFDLNVRYAVVDKGVASGSSLIMTSSEQKRDYQVYGASDSSSGRAMVELGYRKRLL